MRASFAASVKALRLMLLSIAMTFAFVAPAAAQDTDNDGIPDAWERSGYGPLDPSVHNVRVGRPDIIVSFARRPSVSVADFNASVAAVQSFYARVPTRNPDGSTGINVVLAPALTIAAADVDTDYRVMYARSVPTAWRGIARGMLVGAGSGGQTIASDWGSSGVQWQSIAHEIGHQLGLQHAPPGSTGVSPLWPSIMNYMYSYRLNGDPNAVAFSTGRFNLYVLNEGSLNETINLPIDRIRFIERDLGFRLRSVSASQTHIDWDRDNNFGETNIQADINDGYSTGAVTPSFELRATSGAPSMATVRDRLYLVYPTQLTTAGGTNTAVVRDASLSMLHFDGTRFSTSPTRLTTRLIDSNPSVAPFGNRLAVAWVTDSAPMVTLYSTTEAGLGSGGAEASDSSQRVDQAVLAGGVVPGLTRDVPLTNRPTAPGLPGPQPSRITGPASDGLWMVTWSASTKRVRVVQVTDSSAAGARPTPVIAPGSSYDLPDASGGALMSDFAVGAALDQLNGRLVVVTYGRNWDQSNKLKLTYYRGRDGRWVFESERWIGTAASGWWGDTAPVIVLDPARPIDGHSQVTLYLRGGAPADAITETYKIQEIADRAQNDGWRGSMMIDEWNDTISPPAAALFRGVHTYALRWSHVDERIPNRIVFYRQTAVVPGNLIDWDEVTFLSTRGLRESGEDMRRRAGLP